ncbi:MAG TPA: hypothetical protein PKC44_13490 [Agitococcus sp.]|nr:hypothetical protein [Agitococcus sp.]
MGKFNFSHEFDYYRLLDDFSILEAAALIADASPNEVNYYDVEERYYLYDTEKDKIFSICVVALKRAIEKEKLPATIITNSTQPRFYQGSSHKEWIPIGDIDPAKTTIEREDLKTWLKQRGFNQGFFFPENYKNDIPYLNPENPHYPKKLAALIAAWEAADQKAEHDTKVNKNPNSFVKQWLIDNADRFNLRDKNQKEAFFEELAKICNWNDVGGRNNQTPPLVSDDENNKKEVLNKKTAINQKLYTKINTIIPSPLDDEMPF